MDQLQAVGVPAGKVQNARDLMEKDQQLAARQWVTAVEHALHGTQHIDRFPAEFSGTPLDSYTASPFFGQHNFEVYAELLGLSQEEVATAIGEGLFV
jgi:crotonobetainyl-CoA:carnitine CoA-transferase CaiB-like acyl-CoA transferase